MTVTFDTGPCHKGITLFLKNVLLRFFSYLKMIAIESGFIRANFVTEHFDLKCNKDIWNSHQYIQKLSWSLEIFRTWIRLYPEIWVSENPCYNAQIHITYLHSIQRGDANYGRKYTNSNRIITGILKCATLRSHFNSLAPGRYIWLLS